MTAQTPRVPEAAAMGIDRAQILASLRRTPRERFERGAQLSRAAALFRKAKAVDPKR